MKGYTKFVKDFTQLPDDMRTGLIEEGKRPALGEETVSPMAIDPVTALKARRNEHPKGGVQIRLQDAKEQYGEQNGKAVLEAPAKIML